jgi:hypothetical protein
MQLEILRSKTSMTDNLRQAARAFTPPSDRSHSAGHSGSRVAVTLRDITDYSQRADPPFWLVKWLPTGLPGQTQNWLFCAYCSLLEFSA